MNEWTGALTAPDRVLTRLDLPARTIAEYEAESYLVDPAFTVDPWDCLDIAMDMVDRVTATPLWRALSGPEDVFVKAVRPHPQILAHAERGDDGEGRPAWVAFHMDQAFGPALVCHELAHLAAPPRSGHGPRFVSVLMLLLGTFMPDVGGVDGGRRAIDQLTMGLVRSNYPGRWALPDPIAHVGKPEVGDATARFLLAGWGLAGPWLRVDDAGPGRAAAIPPVRPGLDPWDIPLAV